MSKRYTYWLLEETDNFVSVIVGPGEDDGIAFSKGERDLAETIVEDHNRREVLERLGMRMAEFLSWNYLDGSVPWETDGDPIDEIGPVVNAFKEVVNAGN